MNVKMINIQLVVETLLGPKVEEQPVQSVFSSDTLRLFHFDQRPPIAV